MFGIVTKRIYFCIQNLMTMSKLVQTATIYYDAELSYHEIPLFRGAVLRSLGKDANVLFHNHIGKDAYRYEYPKVQYKSIHGKAAILCLQEATQSLADILSSIDTHLMIGKRHANILLDSVETQETLVGIGNEVHSYKLTHWLPLNSKNYQLFLDAEDMISRTTLLNHILTANILSFLKGIGVFLEETVKASISNIYLQETIKYKGIGLTAFDVEFQTNVSLPIHVGLGKNASVGFGIIEDQ